MKEEEFVARLNVRLDSVLNVLEFSRGDDRYLNGRRNELERIIGLAYQVLSPNSGRVLARTEQLLQEAKNE